MKNLVYAEFSGTLSFEMMMDSNILIISDGSVFVITTKEYALKYPDEEFEPVSDYAISEYGIRWQGNRLISDFNYSMKSTMW
jgi:hypothetical protein